MTCDEQIIGIVEDLNDWQKRALIAEAKVKELEHIVEQLNIDIEWLKCVE